MASAPQDFSTTCYGCMYDRPGQRDHMGDGGCLGPEEWTYASYEEEPEQQQEQEEPIEITTKNNQENPK